MCRTRISSLAAIALATVCLGGWTVGCTNQGSTALAVSPHGDQTTPQGNYAIVWTSPDVAGSGRIVVPGQLDLSLTPAQIADLSHALFNLKTSGQHGWMVTPTTDENGDTWLVVDPHPHGVAPLYLSYDAATGRAEGHVPVAFPAPRPALSAQLRDFILRTTGIPSPQDVVVTKLTVDALGYSFHWNPDARSFEPADVAYPDIIANGIVLDATFLTGETEGTVSVRIERMTGDASGSIVADCPECAQSTSGGRRRPIVTNP